MTPRKEWPTYRNRAQRLIVRRFAQGPTRTAGGIPCSITRRYKGAVWPSHKGRA